jgi:hypothetical protein
MNILKYRVDNIKMNEKTKMKFSLRNILDLNVNGLLYNLEPIYKFIDYVTLNGYKIGCIIDDGYKTIWTFLLGTKRIDQVKKELDFKYISLNYKNKTIKCHKGIYEMYKNSDLSKKIRKYTSLLPNRKLIISGYSIGGCLALLEGINFNNKVQIYTFGSPIFSKGIVNKNIRNIQNTLDIVPNIFNILSLTGKHYEPAGKIYSFSYDAGCYKLNHSLITYFNYVDSLRF